MSSTLIIVLVVVAVALALAVVAGVVVGRRRRIDLTEGEPEVEETRPAGYKAGGGISLAPGGEAPVVVKEPEPETPEPEAEPEPEPVEEIAPTAGRLERLRGRLARSQSTFGQGLLGLLGAGYWDAR